jgi:hypothetical protein
VHVWCVGVDILVVVLICKVRDVLNDFGALVVLCLDRSSIIAL